MRQLIWVAFLLLCADIPAWSQEECAFGSEEAFNATERALSNAESCDAAVAKFSKCAWGSSADTRFASIVVEKCEKTFLGKLSAAEKKRYTEEMQLCAYRYARQEGTMWMAFAAGCQVDVAAHFAADPAGAGQPAARASFDCDKAQTALEKAICSDISLGHADIVLSRVYKETVEAHKEDRSTLIQNEKQWLQGVPGKCGVAAAPLSQKSLDCIRNEFELRFTALDRCIEDLAECLQSPGATRKRTTAPSAAKRRASFDCEKPATPLENVICADAELGQTDIKLAQAYRDADKAMTGQHQELVDSQRQWLRFVNGACPMGAARGIPPLLTRLCVRSSFETRIAQLQSCSQKEQQERIPCLNDFKQRAQ